MSTPAADKPNVTDAITITDTPTIVRHLIPLVVDALTIGETPTVFLPTLKPAVVVDVLTMGEVPTINVLAPSPNLVSVDEPVAVREDQTTIVKISIFVLESVAFSVQSFIAPTDALTIAETTILSFTSYPSITETLTIAEVVTVWPHLLVTAAEDLTITDAPTILITNYRLLAVDALTVGDVFLTGPSPLSANITDPVTLDDAAILDISPLPDLFTVDDSITVSEDAIIIVSQGQIAISLSESLRIDDYARVIIPPPPPRYYLRPRYDMRRV